MPDAKITILPDEPIGVIRPELYGHFAEHLGACVDEGIWVGNSSKIRNYDGLRADVIDALRRLQPPVVRWPGGCFADDYHWRDGIGPRESRPRTVNLWWGQSIETNQFGTHEFMRFCELIGAKPYLSGNVGSGTVREMRDWVEYCNFAGDSTLTRLRRTNGAEYPFNVKYWGVGNEPWGCGGNFCPEDYASEYRRYATFLRDLGDTKLFLVACGPDVGGQGRDDLHEHWTRRFFEKFGNFDRIHGLAAHYYCGTAGTATSFTTDQWYELLHRAARMDDVIRTHRAIMDEFDRKRRIGLLVDEWGTWHPPAPGKNPAHLWQQNTLRDALVAAITLNIFNNHADKLVMCNIAQMVNVLQAMILTEVEKLVLTPTFHVFEMFKGHQGALALRTIVESPDVPFADGEERRSMPCLSASASIASQVLTLTVSNVHASLPLDIEIQCSGQLSGAHIVSMSHSDLAVHNAFAEPDTIRPRELQIEDFAGHLQIPAASVVRLTARVR